MSYRWGIAATGGIATGFADAMRMVDGGQVVAVASRAPERAREFADRFEIERAYGYEDLAADPHVDIVYIGTPHPRHASDSLRYLEAGKHVLCEKPFALNAAQARDVARVAREHDRFVMEAMWSRFLPSYVALREVLESGRIGASSCSAVPTGWLRRATWGRRASTSRLPLCCITPAGVLGWSSARCGFRCRARRASLARKASSSSPRSCIARRR